MATYLDRQLVPESPEELTLRRVRAVLRDLECAKRKEADAWHQKGARWEPLRLAAQADALDEAVRYLLQLEAAKPTLKTGEDC